MITPNEEELLVIVGDHQNENEAIQSLHARGIAKVWLRKGSQGSIMYESYQITPLLVPFITIIDSTGAGDAALAGWIMGYVKDEEELTAMQLGHSLALEVLKMKGAVDYSCTKEKLYQIKKTYYNE